MTLNVARARKCLDCAEFAYLDMTGPKGMFGSPLDVALRDAGLALISIYDRDGAQGFLAHSDGEMYLAFRGTESLGDWNADRKYIKTAFKGGGRVHRGFYGQFLSIVAEIERDLDEFQERPLIVTGHSLGAAIAQLAGVWFKATEGYVFGSPRVGNSDFVKRVKFPLYRFEHWTDPVTFLPPRTSPWQIAAALIGFRKPTFYDRAGRVILTDGKLHRMVHYRSSVTEYLDELERRLAA